jgi:two-component system LytT family sensor kinase
MQLEMKTRCERCGSSLLPTEEAYICSYECTFCPQCSLKLKGICSHCGGELIRRPRRVGSISSSGISEPEAFASKRPWLIWVGSFAVWTLIAVANGTSIYQWKRSFGYAATWRGEITLPLVNFLIFAFFTPIIFYIAWRYPIQQNNWGRRTSLYLVGSLAFTVLHVVARVLVYPVNNPLTGHPSGICWKLFQQLFLYNVADDIFYVYLPMVVIVHTFWYYQRFRDREFRTAQLEGQLTKANLQALKAQLRPHFLFNTMHSISALMLTDVRAADQMMSRLSDLLRMSLDNDGAQLTSLSHELEFVAGYLEIEKIRFGDRLNIVLDVAAETLDAQVPHLLLQPLVENAVRHGIAKVSKGGEIRMAATHEGDTLHLAISDNGPRLDNLDMFHGKGGLGLRATQERLQTLYGNRQTLEVRVSPHGGVEASIRIPFQLVQDNSS